MRNKKKFQALNAVIEAYEEKGTLVQYDQLSMDRVAGISARRIGTEPPEAANNNHYIFLDCSSFCWACYYEAFGYKLESDLTWHMIDLIKPRIYYYEITHKESEEDIETQCKKIKSLLEPGDLIVYQNEGKTGHAMIYLDEKEYINCSQQDKFNGYSYDESKQYLSRGGIIREDTDSLFDPNSDSVSSRNYLFGKNKRRVAVLRPLDKVEGLTDNTTARITGARDLNIDVECSYPPGLTADIGKPINYYVNVTNNSSSGKELSLYFKAPDHTSPMSDVSVESYLRANAKATFSFTVEVLESVNEVGKGSVIINGLKVSTPSVCVGRLLQPYEWDDLIHSLRENKVLPQNYVDAALAWYVGKGASAFLRKNEIFYNLFALKDGVSGDVLYRFPQDPKCDAAALKLYGGIGVVCPDISTGYAYKENQIELESLLPGDIILVSKDATCTNQYSCFYTGEAMFFDKSIDGGLTLSNFTEDKDSEKYGYILDSDVLMREFIDKLFGEFAFVVLRPSLSLEG
jgi:hypothetical protein